MSNRAPALASNEPPTRLPRNLRSFATNAGARIGLLLPLLFAAAAGAASDTASEAAPQRPWLREEAAERGLHFEHDSGHRERYLMPEIMSGGAALFDMDGDGDLDAYLVQAGPIESPGERQPNRLFRNRGDGTFEDVTEGSGAGDRGYGTGVAAGDYDNDGDTDLFVTNVGPGVLLRNQGGGKFTDVSGEAGLGHSGWGSSAVFFDADRDGDLDLFVTSYLNWTPANEIRCFDDRGRPDYCSPLNYDSPAKDRLFRNNGDGTFADATTEAGLDVAFGSGLGVVPGDFNGDGWPDLFVANDGMLDQLWLNHRKGGFTEEAILWGCAVDQAGKPKAGMGVAAADIDHDGDLDLVVCNLIGETDSLYLNQGGYFSDHTATAGIAAVSRPFTRFGVAWQDFDNDGELDLYEANGRVAHDAPPLTEDPFAEPNLIFRGLGGGRFEEVLPRGGTAEPLIATSRGAAFGDVDGDGGVDVLVVNRDGPAHLLRNIVPDRGNWIRLRVLNRHGGDALGARLTVKTAAREITREVWAASSYLASNDPRVHIGLGSEKKIERVAVRWPDGSRECFGPQVAGREAVLRSGKGGPCE